MVDRQDETGIAIVVKRHPGQASSPDVRQAESGLDAVEPKGGSDWPKAESCPIVQTTLALTRSAWLNWRQHGGWDNVSIHTANPVDCGTALVAGIRLGPLRAPRLPRARTSATTVEAGSRTIRQATTGANLPALST